MWGIGVGAGPPCGNKLRANSRTGEDGGPGPLGLQALQAFEAELHRLEPVFQETPTRRRRNVSGSQSGWTGPVGGTLSTAFVFLNLITPYAISRPIFPPIHTAAMMVAIHPPITRSVGRTTRKT